MIGFILPLILLEVNFYLPLNLFFCAILNEYGITLGKLSTLFL